MNKFFITLSLILALPGMILSSDKPTFPGFLPGYNGSELPIQYLPGTPLSVETVVDATQEAITNTTDTRSLQDIALITAGITATAISFSYFPKTTTAALIGVGLFNSEVVKNHPTEVAVALAGAACVWGVCKTTELFKKYTYVTELTQDQNQIEAYQLTAFIKQNPRITITTTRTADLQSLYAQLNQWITQNFASFNVPNQTLVIETSLKLRSDYLKRTLAPIEINLTGLQTQVAQAGNGAITLQILLQLTLPQALYKYLTANFNDIQLLLANGLLDNTTAQATISEVCPWKPLTKKTVTQTITSRTVFIHNAATNTDVETFITRTFELLKEYISDKDADKELEIAITFTKHDGPKKVFYLSPLTIRTFNGKRLFQDEEYNIATDKQHTFLKRSERYNAAHNVVAHNLWTQYCQQALGEH